MPDISVDDFLENTTFDELVVGESASLAHKVTQREIDLFAAATGDVNPASVDPTYAATDTSHHIVIHGMWGGSLISAVLGTLLPGPGTVHLRQGLCFRSPIGIGDIVTATLKVTEKRSENFHVIFDCVCTNQHGVAVITGTAEVAAPRHKLRLRRTALPEMRVGRHDAMQALVARAASGPATPTAVVHPVDASSLRAALAAARIGLILPVLIGPAARIQALAREEALDIACLRLLDVPDASGAAGQAVALARAGEVRLVMKGDLHTDQFMHPIVASQTGLRTDKHISHVYVLDVPDYPRLLLLTDMAINIAPTLAEKIGIVQNAIGCAHVIGIPHPRVAILAATETVNPRMQATVDAAALCKMADRRQITGGILDGPLAFDNAISTEAATEKGIVSEVAGRADILVVPDLDAGNMLAKQFTFLTGAEAAGVVLGASVPIILTSRADSIATKIASCALGVLVARAGAEPPAPPAPPAREGEK
jgi:phosphotransacetylase/acyl dehydratase